MRDFAARVEALAETAPSACSKHRSRIEVADSSLEQAEQESAKKREEAQAAAVQAHHAAATPMESYIATLDEIDVEDLDRGVRRSLRRTRSKLEHRRDRRWNPLEPKTRKPPELAPMPPLPDPSDIEESAAAAQPKTRGTHESLEALERLASLKEQGALTDEEFGEAKAKLLEDL
jgi:hypothetical protein